MLARTDTQLWSSDQGWQQARRVLCVRLDSLGDVLMTTPALRALKEQTPGRHLTLLTSPSGASAVPLLRRCVDDCLVFQAPWVKSADVVHNKEFVYEQAERLQQGNFDAAVIFTVYSQNPLPAALLCYLAEIPLRLSYCRENPYALVSHWIPDEEPERRRRHEVQRQLDLVATVGATSSNKRISIDIPPKASQRVDRLLAQLFNEDELWVVMHPGATAASRRYPPERFASVARKLVTESNCQVVITGGPTERELVQQIRTQCRVPTHAFVGTLDVAEFAALIARAALVVSNNTAAVHLAAGVGTPVVDLYALTNPQHTPWQVPHRLLYRDVPCKYCYKSVCPMEHHKCLRGVSPGAVVSAVEELLEHTGASSRRGTRRVYARH